MVPTRRLTACLAAIGLALGLLVAAAIPAGAAPAPVVPSPANAVTADALPTVQVDGVVWSQVVIGTTVYAGGSFANARPPGAAPGTNLVPRSNLLAYDLTTGQLVTAFAGWTESVTDATATLQAPGAVGVYAYLSGSATNAPITLGLPSFVATAP